MKKYLYKILTLIFTTCLLLGCFAGCKHEHEHTFSDKWYYNNYRHWKVCTSGCDLLWVQDKHEIGFDGKCSICSMDETPNLVYQFLGKNTSRLAGIMGKLPKIIIIEREYNGAPVVEIGEKALLQSQYYDFYGGVLIYIPKTVTKIGRGAFCFSRLNEIIYEGTMKEWEEIEKGDYWAYGQIIITCVDGTIEFVG